MRLLCRDEESGELLLGASRWQDADLLPGDPLYGVETELWKAYGALCRMPSSVERRNAWDAVICALLYMEKYRAAE